jgi:hypothetical protein
MTPHSSQIIKRIRVNNNTTLLHTRDASEEKKGRKIKQKRDKRVFNMSKTKTPIASHVSMTTTISVPTQVQNCGQNDEVVELKKYLRDTNTLNMMKKFLSENRKGLNQDKKVKLIGLIQQMDKKLNLVEKKNKLLV